MDSLKYLKRHPLILKNELNLNNLNEKVKDFDVNIKNLKGYEIRKYDNVTDDLCSFLTSNYSQSLRLTYIEFDKKSIHGFDKIYCLHNKYSNDIVACVVVDLNTFVVGKNKLKIFVPRLLCVDKRHRNLRFGCYMLDYVAKEYQDMGHIGMYPNYKETKVRNMYETNVYRRPFKPKLLCKTGYISNKHNKSMDEYYSCEKDKMSKRIHKMEKKHIPEAYKAYIKYMDKRNFYKLWTMEEFEEEFCGNNNVRSYIYCDKDDNVVDFFSYYVENVIIRKKKKRYRFEFAKLYNFTANVKTEYKILKGLINKAYLNGHDCISAIDVMDISGLLYDFKFTQGPSHVKYNMWNYNTLERNTKEMGYINYCEKF